MKSLRVGDAGALCMFVAVALGESTWFAIHLGDSKHETQRVDGWE